MSEVRKCPHGHVTYRVGDTFHIGPGRFNDDKNFCPVCGAMLEVLKLSDSFNIYTWEGEEEE